MTCRSPSLAWGFVIGTARQLSAAAAPQSLLPPLKRELQPSVAHQDAVRRVFQAVATDQWFLLEFRWLTLADSAAELANKQELTKFYSAFVGSGGAGRRRLGVA